MDWAQLQQQLQEAAEKIGKDMDVAVRGPSENGFNWHSTAEDVAKDVNLEGKVCRA